MRLSIPLANGNEQTRVVEMQDNKQADALRTRMERLFADDPGLAVSVASQPLLTHLSHDSEG